MRRAPTGLGAAALALLIVISPASIATFGQSEFAIPREFQKLTAFVRALEHAGLNVQRMDTADLDIVFGTLDATAYIDTNQGALKVAQFMGRPLEERVRIRYVGNLRKGIHEYQFTGISPLRLTIESTTPLYFTITGQWLVETRDGATDMALKKAFEQSGPDAPPVVSREPQ